MSNLLELGALGVTAYFLSGKISQLGKIKAGTGGGNTYVLGGSDGGSLSWVSQGFQNLTSATEKGFQGMQDRINNNQLSISQMGNYLQTAREKTNSEFQKAKSKTNEMIKKSENLPLSVGSKIGNTIFGAVSHLVEGIGLGGVYAIGNTVGDNPTHYSLSQFTEAGQKAFSKYGILGTFEQGLKNIFSNPYSTSNIYAGGSAPMSTNQISGGNLFASSKPSFSFTARTETAPRSIATTGVAVSHSHRNKMSSGANYSFSGMNSSGNTASQQREVDAVNRSSGSYFKRSNFKDIHATVNVAPSPVSRFFDYISPINWGWSW